MFDRGQYVRLTKDGRTYYEADFDHPDRPGTVVLSNQVTTTVKIGSGRFDVMICKTELLEPIAPSDDEIADAIASIMQTPRRGQ